tara:strand:- start:79 stop:1161 length:1083 start_codon:yes stop_codon:yes gene_type:complete
MISLSKSGYAKFIRGELTPTDLVVAPIASGLNNSSMNNANIGPKRTAASSATPTFPINDFAAVYYPNDNEIRINGRVNINTTNFSNLGDVNIFQHGVVLDSTDSNDFIGTILLYPDTDPITYSALNSAPINIDYRVTGMSKLALKTMATSSAWSIATSDTYASIYYYDDTFVNGFLNLPFFGSDKTVDLLNDLKIALFRTTLSNVNFIDDIYDKSKIYASLKELADDPNYTFISAGFEHNELGIASEYPCLTALDTTINIPGLNIVSNTCFCVLYYETSDITDFDVNSANYQNNSFLISTISNSPPVQSGVGSDPGRLHPFRETLILDALMPGNNSSRAPAGLMSFPNRVGPGLLGSRLD